MAYYTRLHVAALSIVSQIPCLEYTRDTTEKCHTSTATKATMIAKHSSSSSLPPYKKVGNSLLDNILVHHTTTSNNYNHSNYFLIFLFSYFLTTVVLLSHISSLHSFTTQHKYLRTPFSISLIGQYIDHAFFSRFPRCGSCQQCFGHPCDHGTHHLQLLRVWDCS